MQSTKGNNTTSNTDNLTSVDTVENPINIELNKPSKAKFLFRLGFLGFFIFIAGCGYGLWKHKYRTTVDQEVPESTTSNPKYK
jgi:hypothetical protein